MKNVVYGILLQHFFRSLVHLSQFSSFLFLFLQFLNVFTKERRFLNNGN
jgi:hypothetical protein